MSGGNGRDEKHEAIETVQEVVEITVDLGAAKSV